MSTAIMPQNTLYDFGDSIIKNGMTNSDTTPGGGHLAVGSTRMRLSLTRMASAPPHQTNHHQQALNNLNNININSVNVNNVNNVSVTNVNLAAALLDKISHHQQQQHQQQHRRLERTQSAPAPASSLQISASAAGNTSRYKTELCRPYEEFGICKYGDKCQFAHGAGELRSLTRHPKYKTELCRTFHTVGFCPYGPRCHFVHNQDEVLQKNHPAAVAALLSRAAACTAPRPRPTALSPALSLDSSSPPCSLSQSPTSSMGSFFSSEPELNSPTLPTMEEQRLPVFNRLSTADLLLSELMLH